jgi:glutathione S-transferase
MRVVALPRLVYLPFRAMAETSRMMLAHGSVSFEDEAVWGAQFHRRKLSGEFPWGKTPVLQLPAVDGSTQTVAQSGAIARWSAWLAGCYPSDPRRRQHEHSKTGRKLSVNSIHLNIDQQPAAQRILIRLAPECSDCQG